MRSQVHARPALTGGRKMARLACVPGSPTSCNAFMTGMEGFGAAVEAAKHTIQEEIVMEGALHVTAVQVGQCHQRFGQLEDLTAPETEWDAKQQQSRQIETEGTADTEAEAFCLATPMEPTEEELRQLAGRGNVGRIAAQLEIVQEEVTWRRRAALFAAAEFLESTHVHRRRRAAWLRAMRAARARVKAILAAPQVVLTALQSFDGGDARA